MSFSTRVNFLSYKLQKMLHSSIYFWSELLIWICPKPKALKTKTSRLFSYKPSKKLTGKTIGARGLKITQKVSFNIASEASYVYILSGQKLIKNAKNGPFWRVFENLKLAVKQCYQTGQF